MSRFADLMTPNVLTKFLTHFKLFEAKIIPKNLANIKKVELSAETPDLPFLLQKILTIGSFLGHQLTDFQNQGRNL